MYKTVARMVSALSLLSLLSACGNPAAMGPYGQGYAPGMTGAYNSPYLQQDPYAQQSGYGSGYGFSSDSSGYGAGYGNVDPNQALPPSVDTGSSGYGFASAGNSSNYGQSSPNPYPSTYPSPGNSAYPSPFASTVPGQAQASPVPSAIPDKAPDPIPAATFAQASEDLNILTFNVWGLPGLIGTSLQERFERLGPTLNNYDVVTLQETFSNEIEVLKERSGFNYHVRFNNVSFPRLGSGLYILSKYPVLKTEFKAFGNCTAADCLARKGVLFTRIDHPKIGPVDIYTTHYQAEGTAAAAKIRLEEDNKVLGEIIHANDSPYPTIITGDFNTTDDSNVYQDLMRRFDLVDIFKWVNPNDSGFTSSAENPYKDPDKISKRVDYVFVMKKPGVTVTPLSSKVEYNQPVENYFLSDHFGVSARLKIDVQK